MTTLLLSFSVRGGGEIVLVMIDGVLLEGAWRSVFEGCVGLFFS